METTTVTLVADWVSMAASAGRSVLPLDEWVVSQRSGSAPVAAWLARLWRSSGRPTDVHRSGLDISRPQPLLLTGCALA